MRGNHERYTLFIFPRINALFLLGKVLVRARGLAALALRIPVGFSWEVNFKRIERRRKFKVDGLFVVI